MKIFEESVGWIFRIVEHEYGDPILATCYVTIDQFGDCDVRALLSTVEFTQEMSLKIKEKCAHLGVTGIIRMVRYKDGKQIRSMLRVRLSTGIVP